MTRFRLLPLLVACLVGAAEIRAPAAPPARPPLLPARPFTVGERLEYRIRLGPLTVGTATLEIVRLRRCGDRTAYELRYTARSNGALAALYPVRDRITSWADTLDFRSHRLVKRIREGSYREAGDWRLDHARDEAVRPDRPPVVITAGCHDVFSTLLRLRASRLAPGTSLAVPVLLGNAADSLRVQIGGERRVTVPAGTFTCLAIAPRLGGQGPFRHEGPVTVDLQREGQRLPVRVTVRVPVIGRLGVELVAIRSGPPR